ncbi:MAG TPA: hypothetical protein VEL11_10515 [Candidatus Bathyarchaeia archaeon]|nr:hypothetical protein [Candidatus Bathyarchaeia archaeon]
MRTLIRRNLWLDIINGSQTYWYNRGYAEANNKLPMSSTDVDYTAGYRPPLKT